MSNIFHIPLMDLMITSKCNARCKYCFEEKRISKSLDFDEIKPYFDERGSIQYFMFGGEPLMNAKFLEEMYEYYEKTDLPLAFKGPVGNSARKLITNGTLIDKFKDLIIKHKLNLQISIDGPKDVNDLNRIKANGAGTFDEIMTNIREVCVPNKIEFSLHGVLNRDTLDHIYEVDKFFFELGTEFWGKEYAINALSKNNRQLIFEEDYTDEDIDIVTDEIIKFCDYLWHHPQLKYEEKQRAIFNYLTNCGGVCGAGVGLMAVDHTLNVFPCHRQADNGVLDQEETMLGNIYENDKLRNFHIFNTFYRVNRSRKVMYSTNVVNRGYQEPHYWLNWCPSTNQYTSGAENPYHINSKYVTMSLEIHRLAEMLMKHYNIPRGGFNNRNSGQRNRRHRN